MPAAALLLLIATLLPLVSFGILVFWGKRIGNPLAGWVATFFIGGSFVCSLSAWMTWLSKSTGGFGAGAKPILLPMQWLPVGAMDGWANSGFLNIGLYVDSLTVLMFTMVTFVATLVHIFSIGYMAEDKRFPRFFTYLGLFCFSMLGLVLGGTLLQLFVFWELVGLCSYLLIGFWYEKKSASNAAIKAFVVNRVGDFGFLIGLGILFYHLGNVTLPDVWARLGAAGGGGSIALPGGAVFSSGLLTIMGIGLFCGAIGKSAQFPLHVWLPDAMEGPTPVSALIHAATMVAAGVYLVARIFPILTPDAKLFIAIIGLITLTMAALIAVVQSDIKKVLAYSTLSQLGYMILAMGLGSWTGGLFHLITHAFFKALLFLGSGSVIHAAHHEQELPQYGGLIKKIPWTGGMFFIAVLAIAGTPLFSGYYSKDTILTHAGAFVTLAREQHKSSFYALFFILPAGVAYLTAFYMTRCWTLTFLGKPRNQHLFDHAHESPLMWIPLVPLALLSIFSGKFIVQPMLRNAITETNIVCTAIDKNFNGFDSAWRTMHGFTAGTDTNDTVPSAAESKLESLEERGEAMTSSYVFPAFIVGIGLGIVMYMNGYGVARAFLRIPLVRPAHTWLYRRMYFDELYFSIFVAITMGIAYFCAAFDKYVVDGAVNLVGYLVRQTSVLSGWNDKYVVDGAVNGAAELAQGVGAAVRVPQSGRIRMYVTVLMLAVALGLAGAIIVVLSR